MCLKNFFKRKKKKKERDKIKMMFRKRNKIKFSFKIAFSKKWEATIVQTEEKLANFQDTRKESLWLTWEINSNIEACFLWLEGGKNSAML